MLCIVEIEGIWKTVLKCTKIKNESPVETFSYITIIDMIILFISQHVCYHYLLVKIKYLKCVWNETPIITL